MAKTKRSIAPREFKHSPATPPTSPIYPLDLGQIIYAIEVSRSFVGADGARDRWGWHPLYATGVNAIEGDQL